ncbi:MAG: phasin family protein [Polaromonas sp.]
MTQTLHPFFDFYRVGFKTASDMARSSLEGAARLRNHQLAVIQDALESHAQVAALVNEARGPNELIALPAHLASLQTRTMMTCWAGFFQLASEQQIETAGRLKAQAEQGCENLRQMFAAGSHTQATMMTALQPLLGAASSACDPGRRAGEESTKPVAAPFVAAANTAGETDATKARKQA